jgi:SNF2 family DNA or RNA helicase
LSSQAQLVRRSSITGNNDNNKGSSTTTHVATDINTALMDRYYTVLPPEIRFSSNDACTQPIQDEYRTVLIKNASLSDPLLNGWTLYSHQKRAILVSLLMRRHILALDMGLGKTVIGCCWARAFVRTIPQIQVIVLCPVSLKEEWQRTAQDIAGLSIRGTEQSPTDKHSDDNPNSKKRSKTKVPLLDVTDENSSTFTNATKQRCTTDGVVTIASWAKIPCPEDVTTTSNLRDPQPYIVIADEAHSMQSMASARTRDALRLMLAPNAVGVLLLTGTPVRQCSFGIVCVFANLKIQLAMVDK